MGILDNLTRPEESREITALRRALKGKVITPEDRLYAHARKVFYSGFDRHPAAIVRVAGPGDVARVVSLARQTGLELAVRSGGHSPAGFGVSEGGIVLDLREMRRLTIDSERLTAWAETGLTASELTAATGIYSLATGLGDTGSVGIGGITLGGGVGYLSRKYGLTIDNLLAADVVTADGKLLRAGPQSHPDLFWAIRGGGGNFGVVTRFQYQLHRVSTAVGGLLILPATPEVIVNFIAEAEAAPDELTAVAQLLLAPPLPFLPPETHGKPVLMATMLYAGEIEAGEHVLKRFQRLARPLADQLRSIRYAEIFAPEDADRPPAAASRTLFIDRIERPAAALLLERIQSPGDFTRAVQLRVLGGAIARVPVEETAYAHRQARILANLSAFHSRAPERAACQAWVDELAAALPDRSEGVSVNFLDDAGRDRIHEVYPGRTGQRLAEIKAHYDPHNLFHMNHNIRPEE